MLHNTLSKTKADLFEVQIPKGWSYLLWIKTLAQISHFVAFVFMKQRTEWPWLRSHLFSCWAQCFLRDERGLLIFYAQSLLQTLIYIQLGSPLRIIVLCYWRVILDIHFILIRIYLLHKLLFSFIKSHVVAHGYLIIICFLRSERVSLRWPLILFIDIYKPVILL